MPLHPKSIALLKEVAARNTPGWSEMPPEESRAIFRGLGALFGQGPEVFEVRELSTTDGVPLRLYRPSQTDILPAVVYFHGGGWVIGDIATHDALCRHLAKAASRVVLSVDYRLAPEHPYPAAIDDCFQATCFVMQQAESLGIDARHVAVAGDSAGGNLAAAVALRARDLQACDIESQVLIYPVIQPDFETETYRAYATDHMLTRSTMQWFWQQYLGGQNLVAKYAALLEEELHDLPPALVITAEYDVLRSEGEAYAERLRKAQNQVAYRQFDGMLHGFVHSSGWFEDGLRAIDEIGKFLKERR